MQLTASTRALRDVSVDLLAVPLVEIADGRVPAALRELDATSEGALGRAIESGDFKGRRGESLMLYAAEGAPRLLLLGLGPDAGAEGLAPLREAAAAAVSQASARGATKVAIQVPAGRRPAAAEVGRALAEGAVLGGYRYDRWQQKPENGAPVPVENVQLLFKHGTELRGVRPAVTLGRVLGESQNYARELSNEPPSELPPAALARAAQKLAKEVGLTCKVMGVPELERRKMGGILAVGQGSANPPRLIVLEHDPTPGAGSKRRKKARRAPRSRPTVALVGKGITFDSGGLSIKPSTSMVSMKHDMSGGAAVLGAMRAVALLKLPLRVVGVVASAENMPSGTAYRPDDVVTTASGKTVEISNTDAEGRLVLADALHYARTELEPAAMIDLATLTGAVSIALGPWAAAVMSNQEKLADAIRRAGDAAGERFWPLPLWDCHRQHMKGQIADLKQTGGRDASSTTAGAFLWAFAGDDVPWAHLDIASTANTANATPLQPFGATGFGVRTLVELLRDWKKVRL